MGTTWIIAADESRARVFQIERRGTRHLVQIDNFANPAGRLQDRELRTDAEPRFAGHGGVGKPGLPPRAARPATPSGKARCRAA